MPELELLPPPPKKNSSSSTDELLPPPPSKKKSIGGDLSNGGNNSTSPTQSPSGYTSRQPSNVDFEALKISTETNLTPKKKTLDTFQNIVSGATLLDRDIAADKAYRLSTVNQAAPSPSTLMGARTANNSVAGGSILPSFEENRDTDARTIKTNTEALLNYNKKRQSEIDSEIERNTQIRGVEKYELGFTSESLAQKEDAERKIGELNSYKDDLKRSVASHAAAALLNTQDLENFNPEQIGRQIVSIADPNLDAQFKIIEKEGKTLPGIKRAELSKIGLDNIREYVSENTELPNRDKILDLVNTYTNKFEEDNFELTAYTVKNKLAEYLYNKDKGSIYGILGRPSFSSEKLLDAVNNAGLSETEKKVALNYVLPIEQKIIGTNIPRSGAVSSFLGAIEKSGVNMGNTIADISGLRTEGNQAADLLSGDTRFDKPKNRNYWSKGIDGISDMTGQVVAMGLSGRAASGVAAKIAGGLATATTAANIGDKAGLWISSYLNALDPYKQQSIQEMPQASEGARLAYANTMAFSEAAFEGIFDDRKALDGVMDAIKPSIKDIATKFTNNALTSEAAKVELQKTFLSSIKKFGSEFGKAEIENATEESLADIASGLATSVFGGQDFDIAKTGKQAVETFVTTALYSPIVSGLAARTSVRENNSQKSFLKAGIMDAAKNSESYLKTVEEMRIADQITQQEANEKIALIKGASSYLNDLPENKNFDYPTATSYVIHRLNEGILKEKLDAENKKQSSDINVINDLTTQLKRGEDIRKGIYDGTIQVDDDLNEVTADKKQAEDLGILKPIVNETPNTTQNKEASSTVDVSNESVDLATNKEGIKSDEIISVKDVLDKPVIWNGKNGQLVQDGQLIVFQEEGTNREYELEGNIETIGDKSAKDFGIEQPVVEVIPVDNSDLNKSGIQNKINKGIELTADDLRRKKLYELSGVEFTPRPTSVVSVDSDGSIQIRGNAYINNFSDPIQAINRNENGDIVSVNLETSDGKKRTFKGNVAEDIAYQISLQELTKDNEKRTKFENFINTDGATIEEINNATISNATEEIAIEGDAQVSRARISPIQNTINESQITNTEGDTNAASQQSNAINEGLQGGNGEANAVQSETNINATGSTNSEGEITGTQQNQNTVTNNTTDNATEKSDQPNQEVTEQSSIIQRKGTGTQREAEAQPQTDSGNSDQRSEKKEKVSKTAKKISKTKASEYLRSQSQNIKENGILPSWAKATLPDGTQQAGFGEKELSAAIAKSFDLVADAIDAGAALSEAVNKGFENLKSVYKNNGININEDEVKKGFTNEVKKLVRQQDKKGLRQFTMQVLADDSILPKKEIAKRLEYAVQANAMTVAEAEKLVNEIGVDEAYNVVVENKDIKPAVRVAVGQMLIKKFNTLATNATDQETKEYYIDKTIATADFVSEKLATESGQMIQAFSLYERLSPEAQLRSTIKDIKKASENNKKKQKQSANTISNQLNKANEEAVDEILDSNDAKVVIKRAEKSRVAKAEEKIKKAKARREQIIKKYKDEKGKALYSTVAGLTPEGMEYVGNLAKTYIDEGLANIELIADKVRTTLYDLTKKDISQDVSADISRVVGEKLNESDKRLIGKGLKDMGVDINRIIKEHYTVADKVKKDLAKKLSDEAGLDETDAQELATKIQAAFDRVATRKKIAILEREKNKLENIKNGLKATRKVETKTLQDDIIQMSNLGAFDTDEMLEVISKKLGVGQITPAQAQKIQELAEKIQKAPEGSPKRDATEDLLNYRANIKGSSFLEVAQGVWYANVLSGYKTHLKNIVSTFYNGFTVFGSEVMRNPRAIPFLTVGGLQGLKRGTVEAWHSLSTGRSPIHVLNIETSNILERKQFVGGYLNPANYLKFVTRLMVAEDVLQFQGLKEMKAMQLAYSEAAKQGYKNPLSKETWNKVNEILLNTTDRYNNATQQIKHEGLTGIEAKRRMYELMELSRPIEMTEVAYGFAARGTFNHDTEGSLGALTDLFSKTLDFPVLGARPLRFLVPFTRIITNVVNNALDFSPVGFIRAARGVRGLQSFEGKQTVSSKYVQMSPEDRKQMIARASLGVGLTAALYALTKVPCGDDKEPCIDITGAGTGDYRKDLQLKQSGWQPYSIKIGDTYISYQLTPLVFNLGWIGNRNDREKYDDKFNEEHWLTSFSISAFQSAKMISDMTWISTTANLLNALSANSPDKLVDGVTKEVGNSAKSFILPNAYTQAAQEYETLTNMPQKQVNGIFQSMIQDIPIARNKLNDKINALGEPIVRDSDVFMSKQTADPVWKYLLDKKGWVAPVNKNTLMVFDPKTKQDRQVTDEEYYEFSKQRGTKLKQGIEKVMKYGVLVDNKGKATIDPSRAVGRKASQDLTPDDLKRVINGLGAKATKAVKKGMFSYTE